MIITEHSMADGEVRLYCVKFGSVTAYFTDDDDGGSSLVVEPAPDTWLSESLIRDVRASILAQCAVSLHCAPEAVERRSLSHLIQRLVTPLEKPRHPWLEQRRSRSRSFGR